MRLTTDGMVLDDREADAVIEAALAILERTGVRVEHAGLLERLAACGAAVDPARQVARFPLAVMTDFLAASRRREPTDGTVRFSGCAEIYEGRYLDPADGTYRPWTERTLLDYVRLARALPSVGAASMLGLGRAIGETIAVLMLTGNAAVMPTTVLESVRTMTGTIAAEMGEVVQGGLHYSVLFSVGLVLFVITFSINLAADQVLERQRKRWRR